MSIPLMFLAVAFTGVVVVLSAIALGISNKNEEVDPCDQYKYRKDDEQ